MTKTQGTCTHDGRAVPRGADSTVYCLVLLGSFKTQYAQLNVDCRLITPENVYSKIYKFSYFESELSPGDGTAIPKRRKTDCEH